MQSYKNSLHQQQQETAMRQKLLKVVMNYCIRKMRNSTEHRARFYAFCYGASVQKVYKRGTTQ